MATNFAQAMFQGMDDANQRRLQDQSMQRQNRLADLAVSREERLQQGDQRQQLYGMAKGYLDYVTKNPQGGKQYYDTYLRPEFPKLGFGDPGDYDEAQTKNVAMQVVSAMGGGKASNPYDGLPSDIQSLQLLRDNPQLAAMDKERRQYSGMVPKLVETSQGIGWGTPGASIQLAPLEGVAGQAPHGTAAPQAAQLFAALGNKYGIQPTSVLRSQERNRQVGGVANSYHLSGQAADWVVPQPLKAQFIADAKANGYEAIDEGDHVHIEPAGRGGASQSAVAQPFQKSQSPSELERRLQMAQQMGATQEEQRRMVVGGNSARDAQRISSKDATTARQKVTQIQAARNQLRSARQAFEKIKNSFSAGLGGDYLPTPEGQAFDRAVRNLAPLITAVTRVPGVGAMSDYESRLQEASLPSRGTYENVTLQQFQDLENLLNTVEGGYKDLLSGGQEAPTQADNETSIDDLLDMYR